MKQVDFFQQVQDVVCLIPYGRVTSYGAIAEYLGAKGSARMVGYALHNLILSDDAVPAHRVLNRSGKLTGAVHFRSPSMAERLAEEGIVVQDNQVIDFPSYFWHPNQISLDSPR